MTASDLAGFLGALRAEAPGCAILEDDDQRAAHARDWTPGGSSETPGAVLRPGTVEEVSAILRLATAHRVPVTPQGGMTGLACGAVPSPGGVALSLARFNRIDEIDPDGMTMTLGAGVPLEAAQKAAAAQGLMVPLDLGARGSCALGGNIGTNAGGNRVIRYGMTRDMVLGVEAVLPTGQVLPAMNRLIKNNGGYDLKQLFIGAEGTLGVVTRAVIRLVPQPASISAAVCALGSWEDALAFLRAARGGLGPMLSAFEAMWPDYWDWVASVPGARMPLDGSHPVYVLIEAQGADDAAPERFMHWLETQMEAGLLIDAAVAQSLADVERFWEVRDAVAELPVHFGPHIAFDVALPAGRMDAYAEACRAAVAAEWGDAARSMFYGHVGDGNLHLNVRVEGADPQPKQRICDIVYGLVRDEGGAVSAEHGIGLMKKPWLGWQRSEAEIALMRTLRAAMDPAGIMNPGKLF